MIDYLTKKLTKTYAYQTKLDKEKITQRIKKLLAEDEMGEMVYSGYIDNNYFQITEHADKYKIPAQVRINILKESNKKTELQLSLVPIESLWMFFGQMIVLTIIGIIVLFALDINLKLEPKLLWLFLAIILILGMRAHSYFYPKKKMETLLSLERVR